MGSKVSMMLNKKNFKKVSFASFKKGSNEKFSTINTSELNDRAVS